MGASDFWTTSKGKTAAEAFRNARQEAISEECNGGYTGTIAEKHDFKLLHADGDPKAYAQKVVHDAMEGGKDPHHYEDKWGPALCVELEPGSFLFFGVASD